jgi:hypothetical protein
VQVVHRLDREQHRELLPRLVLRHRETELELAAPLDHVFDHLVDRVLVDAGPAGDDAADRPADAGDELRGRRVAGVLGRVGEQPPQVAVVEVRVVDAVVAALRPVVLAQRLAQPRQRIDLRGVGHQRRPVADRSHQRVHVLELLQRRPSGVPLLPLAGGRQPHGERFREVFVGMALRVPRVEVQHVALAVRLRRVELRIRLRRQAEHRAPLAAQPQAVRVVDRVSGLVAQNPHAPLVLAALDLEHLRFLEALEPVMRQVEGDRDGGGAVGGEPLVRQVEMQRKPHAARVELASQLRNPIRHRPFDREREVRHADLEERFVPGFRPVVTQHAPGHSPAS